MKSGKATKGGKGGEVKHNRFSFYSAHSRGGLKDPRVRKRDQEKGKSKRRKEPQRAVT